MLLYLRAICHVLLWVLLIIKFPTFISLCKLVLFLTNLLITNYHLSQASKPNSATSSYNITTELTGAKRFVATFL